MAGWPVHVVAAFSPHSLCPQTLPPRPQQWLERPPVGALSSSAGNPTAPLDTPPIPQRLVYSAAAGPSPAERQATLLAAQPLAPTRFAPPAAQPPPVDIGAGAAATANQWTHHLPRPVGVPAQQRADASPPKPVFPGAPSSNHRGGASRSGTGGGGCTGGLGAARQPTRQDAQLRSRQGAFVPREGPATLLGSLMQLSKETISRRPSRP